MKMKNIFLQFFPNSISRWKVYLTFSFPVIITQILFAFNGFVDNFMVTSIDQAAASLSYANSWTGIIEGVYGAVGFICAILIGQYFGVKNYQKIKEIMRLRVLIITLIVGIISLFAFLFSKEFIFLFSSTDIPEVSVQQSTSYLKLIIITWLIMCWTSPQSSFLNESGHGRWSLISSIFSLAINIILNLIFIKYLGYGVEGAAYASIAARIFGIFGDTFFVWLKEPKALFNPFLSLFKISKEIWKLFEKRILSALLFLGLMVMIISSSLVYNHSFPPGSLGNADWEIGAASVLGIAFSIQIVFTSVFSAIGSNVSIFVSRNLGAGQIDIAKRNANELKGFHTFIAFIFSLLLGVLVLVVPHIHYLASGLFDKVKEKSGIEAAVEARNVYFYYLQMSLLYTVVFNPIWSWYITSLRVISSGGKTNIATIVEFSAEGIFLIWITIVFFVLKQGMNLDYVTCIFIGYSFEILKLIFIEILNYKIHWAQTITDDQKVPQSI